MNLVNFIGCNAGNQGSNCRFCNTTVYNWPCSTNYTETTESPTVTTVTTAEFTTLVQALTTDTTQITTLNYYDTFSNSDSTLFQTTTQDIAPTSEKIDELTTSIENVLEKSSMSKRIDTTIEPSGLITLAESTFKVDESSLTSLQETLTSSANPVQQGITTEIQTQITSIEFTLKIETESTQIQSILAESTSSYTTDVSTVSQRLAESSSATSTTTTYLTDTLTTAITNTNTATIVISTTTTTTTITNTTASITPGSTSTIAITSTSSNAGTTELVVSRTDIITSFDEFYRNTTFVLDLLQNATYNINGCLRNCSYEGFCRLNSQKNQYQCVCIKNYRSYACEIDIRPCEYLPCINHGVCEDFTNSANFTTNEYKCNCPSFFYGNKCQFKINICHNVTCSGNGYCIDMGTSAKCQCHQYYSGDNCEIQSNELKVIKMVIITATICALIVIVLTISLILMCDVINFFQGKYSLNTLDNKKYKSPKKSTTRRKKNKKSQQV